MSLAPNGRSWRMISPEDRLHFQIEPEPMSGCWLWTGTLIPRGYGRINWGGRQVVVHRLIYEKHRGPIPTGLTLDHLCRVRSCVNPDHLEAVTMRENCLRGESFSAKNARQTHCKRGHALVSPNIYLSTPWKRACVACARERALQYRGAVHDVFEISERKN